MADSKINSVKDIRLDGKVAIVTGGARGMGKVMATALSRAGAAVAIVDIREEQVAATASELAGQARSNRVIGIAADISKEGDCLRAVAQTVTAFGGLHILVNNAGLGPLVVHHAPRFKGTRFWELDPDSYRQIIDTNVVGTFFMSHAATPELLRQGWGRLITVTTGLDAMQRVRFSPYGTSKAALESANLTWAQDLAGTGVTANTLHPGGPADTDFIAPEARAALRQKQALLVPPEVMGSPALWLSSTLSDGVNGARFIARLWDDSLPLAQAVEKAREPQVFLPL